MIEETVTGHPGAYQYGEDISPKEFSLECFFENETRDRIEDILNWFYRGRTGELIFDERPFVIYDATVCSKIEGTLYNGKDATLTIKLKAYCPFGRMAYKELDGADTDGATLYTGIVSKEQMPDAPAGAGDFLMYNPGTEMADTIITLAGSAPNGVTITNYTTGTKCNLLSIPAHPDSLIIDSKSGDVYLASNPDGHEFEAHDEGFIRLAPCIPYQRSVTIMYEKGSNSVIVIQGFVNKNMVGQYALIAAKWRRIIATEGENKLILNQNMELGGTEIAMVASMNEINITADGASFTTFSIDYTPMVR